MENFYLRLENNGLGEIISCSHVLDTVCVKFIVIGYAGFCDSWFAMITSYRHIFVGCEALVIRTGQKVTTPSLVQDDDCDIHVDGLR